jgi:2'-5' RNA ligase
MAVGGVGAFPQLRRPRVIWVGVDGGDALLALQADVERSLEPLGFEREQRAWSPHLTLGRAEPHTRQTSFAGLAALADSVTYEATVDVESVDLMRSHVGRGGARYERIAGPRLRGAMTPSKQEAGT